MQLVDEQDDLAVAALDGVEHGLEPLLKLAPELCAGDERAHIQREELPVLQVFRHIAPDDPLGQALGDGRFAYARLADEDGVVFGLAAEDADHIADLVVPADDGIQLLGPGPLHQILTVFLQNIIGLLRVVGGDAGVAPNGLQRLQKAALGDLKGLKQPLQAVLRLLQQAQHDMLHGDEVVLHLGGLLFRGVQRLIQRLRDIYFIRLPGRSGDLGQRAHRAGQGGGEAVHRDAHPVDQLTDEAVLLLQQRQQQMGLADLLVAVVHGKALGRLDGFHALLGETIEIHNQNLP